MVAVCFWLAGAWPGNGSLAAAGPGWWPAGERALRFAGIEPQQLDQSCGFAAVATALQALGRAGVSEQAVMARGGLPGPQGATVRQISTAVHAFDAQAFPLRSRWELLANYYHRYGGPVILRWHKPEPHFVVLLDVDGYVAVVADPARGYQVLARAELERRWDGVAVIVRGEMGASAGEPDPQDTPRPADGRGPGAAWRPFVRRHRQLVRLQERLSLSGWGSSSWGSW